MCGCAEFDLNFAAESFDIRIWGKIVRCLYAVYSSEALKESIFVRQRYTVKLR